MNNGKFSIKVSFGLKSVGKLATQMTNKHFYTFYIFHEKTNILEFSKRLKNKKEAVETKYKFKRMHTR